MIDHARVLSIVSTAAHDAALDELVSVSAWPRTEETALRRASPNGLHRLSGLVPELAPDQAALAKLLAESALLNRREDFMVPQREPSADALALFDAALAEARSNHELAESDEGLAARLARRAKGGSLVAWDAVAMFYDAQLRCRIVRTDGELTKELTPVPAPIDRLLRALLSGGITRPIPKARSPIAGATPEQVDALIFAMWAATESGIKATRRAKQESACTIVAELCGCSPHDLARAWQARLGGTVSRNT